MSNDMVWRDWLGIWHASVPLSGSRHADALAARRAIIAEAKTLDPAAVHVTRERITHHGTVVYQQTAGHTVTTPVARYSWSL